MKFFTIDDINLIDLDALVRMLPGANSWNVVKAMTRGQYVTAILRSWDVLNKAEINTPRRLAHFIGQCLIETGFLNFREENLNYSAAGLLNTFPKYYKGRPELAQQHARKPELIANHVYGGRMGNTTPGDGWKYRGRGMIQLTGKENYERFSKVLGLDLVSNPDVVAKDLKVAIQAAAAFWSNNGLNILADSNNAAAVSRGVNLGNPNAKVRAHDEDLRILWTQKVLGLMNAPNLVTNDPNQPLDIGSSGDRVKMLQEQLDDLGYDVKPVDGVFGRKTRAAILLFQDDRGLEKTGLGDAVVFAELQEALADPKNSRGPQKSQAVKGAYS